MRTEFTRRNTFVHFVRKSFRSENYCANIWNRIRLEIYEYLVKTTNKKMGIITKNKTDQSSFIDTIDT